MDNSLSLFELPKAMVAPALAACRGFNTGVDVLFYDVPTLVDDLRHRGDAVETDGDAVAGPRVLDFSAAIDPEGSLLVVDDAARAPFIRAFETVPAFLAWHETADEAVEVACITGVGSSALGSAALAWDVSKSLKRPVLAIVPGYGVADVVLQGLGGWFGFGLHDFLHTKSHVQIGLALMAPGLASVGRRLSASSPRARRAATGAPVFRTGCGSSDVLHDLMQFIEIKCVVGHSKGALAIANALRSLAPERVTDLRIVTLGCPIAEEIAGASYHQFLGLFDALGQANAWGHRPDTWVASDHSTNPTLPLSMDAGDLVAS